jgi:hypothetical protein
MSNNKKLSTGKSGTNQFFGNELNLNLIKNTKLKLINNNNDKNNNNDEENYENQYQTLRKDDQTDQIVNQRTFELSFHFYFNKTYFFKATRN